MLTSVTASSDARSRLYAIAERQAGYFTRPYPLCSPPPRLACVPITGGRGARRAGRGLVRRRLLEEALEVAPYDVEARVACVAAAGRDQWEAPTP